MIFFIFIVLLFISGVVTIFKFFKNNGEGQTNIFQRMGVVVVIVIALCFITVIIAFVSHTIIHPILKSGVDYLDSYPPLIP